MTPITADSCTSGDRASGTLPEVSTTRLTLDRRDIRVPDLPGDEIAGLKGAFR